MRVTLYQNSDNVIRVPVVDDETGLPVSASDFPSAEYLLATRHKKVVYRTTLGEAISVDGDEFVVKIDDGVLTEDLGRIKYHQLTVWNAAGDKLPPVVQGEVDVVSVIN